MSLKDYRFPEHKVTDGITVRGLSMVDISALAHEHYDLLERVFQESRMSEDTDMKTIIAKFTPKMPPLAASIIALGCGEPESADIAARLSLGIQVEAIQRIGELTFSTEGGARQVFQTVMNVMQATTALMTEPVAPTPLKNGFGESAAKFPS